MSHAAHILVVDDEPEIAESLADFLHRKGYRVNTAVTGPQAIEILEAAHEQPDTAVDLVLLDMRMPDMSGLQLLAWLRQHNNTPLSFTRVIMLTAASGNREKVEALNAGADDYITKPYHTQELLARVQTLLRTQQLEKQLQHQRQQIAELNQINNSLSSDVQTPLPRVFQIAADSMQQVLEVAQVGIFVVANNSTNLICRYLSDTTAVDPPYPVIPLGQGLLGQLITTPRTVRLNDPTADPQLDPHTDIPPGRDLTSLLAVPISVRGQTQGVVVAFNKQMGKQFSEFDLNLLTSHASSLSSAVENALLFQRVNQRQQELLDSRNTLQAIIDGILHPIYTINDDWKLVAINQGQADAAHKPIAKLVGRICYEAFHGRVSPCDHCQAHHTLRHKQPQAWSTRWLGDDHLPQEWDINAYPVPAKQAESASAVIVWQDRTEERRLEQSLLQAGKLAAIGQLAAGVAHEINNPLTVINANAEMLKLTIKESDDPDNYEGLDLIHRAGVRAARVVGGLLDFAREHQYIFVPLDINQSLEQALELVAYQMNVAHVTVQLDLAPSLPRVAASSEHIKSVWINLLVNARDALRDANTAVPHITITTRLTHIENNPHIQVTIKDNGPGISPAEAAHIFEPFYTTKDPGKGTGLGLATCLRIIKQHHGSIEMVSDTGQGASFIILLPAHTDPVG